MDARQIIERLGGSAEVARKLKSEKNTVYQWMKRGVIPEAIGWRIIHVYGEQIVTRADLNLPQLD